MFGLFNLACSGFQIEVGNAFNPQWTMGTEDVFPHPRLLRRVKTILDCKAYATVFIRALFTPKKFCVHYFCKANPGIWRWVIPNVTREFVTATGPGRCFYLGKYPILFSLDKGAVQFPHAVTPHNTVPITDKFYYPGYDEGILRDLSPDRWSYYLPDKVIGAYKVQRDFWKHWFNLQDICIGQNYTAEKPPPKKKTWVKVPPIEGPWPGIPLEEMKPPPPEPPPPESKDPALRQVRLKLKFTFAESKRPIGMKATFTET